jgi:hypothetical protein
MYLRTILFATLMLVCCGPALAQRPGPEFWRRVSCEPLEPRTKLETFEYKYGAVIIRGFTRVRTVEFGLVRVDALEVRELGTTSRTKGVVIALQESEERRRNDNRAFVDYEEIDPLLNAIDVLSRTDETTTKLAGFEARYRTLGDLEIAVFRQTRSGTAVTMTTGICTQTIVHITLDDLAKVKAMILDAKMRLDEIR